MFPIPTNKGNVQATYEVTFNEEFNKITWEIVTAVHKSGSFA